MADIRNQLTLCPVGTFGFCFGRCKFQAPNLCISGKFPCLFYPGLCFAEQQPDQDQTGQDKYTDIKCRPAHIRQERGADVGQRQGNLLNP